MQRRIVELADLMEEFGLAEAELESDGKRVAFRRRSLAIDLPPASEALSVFDEALSEPHAVETRPAGTPVTSPMTGIFFPAPSPNAAPFVKEGEPVMAGQVVGL